MSKCVFFMDYCSLSTKVSVSCFYVGLPSLLSTTVLLILTSDKLFFVLFLPIRSALLLRRTASCFCYSRRNLGSPFVRVAFLIVPWVRNISSIFSCFSISLKEDIEAEFGFYESFFESDFAAEPVPLVISVEIFLGRF